MTLALILIGFGVGTLGTLIGAGGGFILMPILLLLYPHESPSSLTSISLGVVFLNALSGSAAYAYKRKIHYRSALLFSIAAAPGSYLGALATEHLPRASFQIIFGILMTAMAIYLLWPKRSAAAEKTIEFKYPVHRLVDRDGHEHLIAYNLSLGLLISAVVGFLSSLLGIGGGIIHVPALVHILNFPVHVATATSHAILAAMAAIGTGEHILGGDFNGNWERTLLLAPGVVIGAQLGAYLSAFAKERFIMRALAVALLSVGVRFIFFA